MYELTFDGLVMNNVCLIHNWNKNIAGITLHCTENPNNHLSLLYQALLLREVEQYYLSTIISKRLEEVDNVWEGITFSNEELELFWGLYVEDIEVSMEHIREGEDEGDTDGDIYIPKYPVDGLGSGLLSL